MDETSFNLNNGDACLVVGGTHRGKQGIIQDKHVSKSGQITITVAPESGTRFKTLLKNVRPLTNTSLENLAK